MAAPRTRLDPPSEFLDYMHGSKLDVEVGKWVIETALHQIEAWESNGIVIPVSVNISANHLKQVDFTDDLALMLGRHPAVSPGYLELEVLETAAISNMSSAIDVLNRCIDLGVCFALDDFGTGYSSLTYFRQLPVRTLKIDQSFVRDMLVDKDDCSCGFRGKLDTDSRRRWTVIPAQAGQRFRGKVDTDSRPSWTVI